MNNRGIFIAQFLPPAESDGRFDLLRRGINLISDADDRTTLQGENMLVRPTLLSSTVTINSGYTFGNLDIEDGGILTHRGSRVADGTAIPKLDLNVDVLTIDDISKIDVTGKGYLGGLGRNFVGDNESSSGRTLGNALGASSSNNGGGSYGGRGSGSSNGVYGDFRNPNELGSGGARARTEFRRGGNGGGLVRISANSIQLDGTIVANGTRGDANCCASCGR